MAIQELIDEFILSASSGSEGDMIYDLTQLNDAVKKRKSFSGSHGIFGRVCQTLMDTESGPLFRHCANFLYRVLDFYSIEFLSKNINESLLQTVAAYVRASPEKLIRRASKFLSYFASLTSAFRDIILALFPFEDVFASIRIDDGCDEWNSSLIRIIASACEFSLPREIGVQAAQFLLAIVTRELGVRSLLFSLRALLQLTQNAEVCELYTVESLSFFPPIISHFSAIPDPPNSKHHDHESIILAILRIAHCIHSANSALLLPPELVISLVRHKTPFIADAALSFVSHLVLADPDTFLVHFLSSELFSHLCDNIRWRSAGVKMRSADLLCLLAPPADDGLLELVVGKMILPSMIDLFEADDSSLNLHLMEFIGSAIERAIEVGYGHLVEFQLAEAGAITAIANLASSEDEGIARFASGLLPLVNPGVREAAGEDDWDSDFDWAFEY
jgi:hypothetical protein